MTHGMWPATFVLIALAAAVCGQTAQERGMQGPDFDFGRVADWQVGDDGNARLTLDNASRWSIATSAPYFESVRMAVALAERMKMPVFVSGERRTGRLERVALPEKLMPADVAKEPVDGKLDVVFHGPPTPAFLRSDRPWFTRARERLLTTLAREKPTELPPPLLVTIDVVTREIMDVRAP
jgi:hypothetical protein